MKTFICIISVFLMTTIHVQAQSQSDSICKVTVNIKNLNAKEGKVYISLFTKENWLSKGIKSGIGEIVDGESSLVLTDVPYGTYGISAFHDENKNGELDKGMFGIPNEPYACSFGAKGFMGPPKFKDAKFTLDSANKILIITF